MKKPKPKSSKATAAEVAPKGDVCRIESCKIVAIGTSAGGLEALELFLRAVPPDSGLAYVVVQHLDPNNVSLLPELLQRFTKMKVVPVTDGTRVAANQVFVIPPNKNMSVLHGALHLFDLVIPRGVRLPIDFFFRSLADDCEERSIGVILSGMGSDGTLGLKAIKGRAGVVFVQEPASAKFSAMPESAIKAGVADFVGAAERLPEQIMAYVQNSAMFRQPLAVALDPGHALEQVVILLRSHTRHDFSLYKSNTVIRRIERRMGIHQISTMSTYVRYLQEHPSEIDALFKELLIGVTSFFRDPAAWEALSEHVLPALLKQQVPATPLRVWAVPCSTGEEAYSLAILFREALDAQEPRRNLTVQIFATDLDPEAIEKARVGHYLENIAADVSPERLARHFVKTETGYQISAAIRSTVVFAPHNVGMDPPFTKLNLISCRNLLIYLSPELQAKLMPLFQYALNPGGFLFLGRSETVGTETELFAPVDEKSRIYRRMESATRATPLEFPRPFLRARATKVATKQAATPADFQSAAERLLLQAFAPAAVLVNPKGDILFVSGRTNKYLEAAPGTANWNLFVMAHDGLRHTLGEAVRAALTQETPVIRKDVHVGLDDPALTVDLTIQAVRDPESLRGLVLVVFTEVQAAPAAPTGKRPARRPARAGADAEGLQENLAQLRVELQSSREDMQSSAEELNSANEEFQSANEELQSTNEELTTSQEETQSMNEELQTLNHELQAKVDDLSRISNDMKNLLESTDIATLFLDADLCVRLFTAGSSQIFKLIPADVGRSIGDFASALDYPALVTDAREVLRTLTVHERRAASRDGHWFLVRIMPYRTLDNMVEGVAITFADITTSTALEERLRATQAGLELHIVDQAAQLHRAESRPRALNK